MSLRRSQKRKSSSKLLNVRQNGKRKSLPSITDHRTRSKTLRNVASETNFVEPISLSRRSSDSSIVYLGSYRKVPELINLEDSCDSYEGKSETRSAKFDEIQSVVVE